MDVLVERLDARLREWKPETAAQVRECVSEVIERFSTCSMSPQPGDVWLADLGFAAKTRPAARASVRGAGPQPHQGSPSARLAFK